jgi:hypothetical protein
MTPAAPPATASIIASDRNWILIWPLVAPRARRSPISLAAFQDRDDHDVRHSDRSDQQRNRAQPQEQRIERAGGVSLRSQRGRGLGHVDLARFSGSACAPSRPSTVLTAAGVFPVRT